MSNVIKSEVEVMLTEFGKVMRIIRINTGDSMRDMAAKIGMSATYLSAIEIDLQAKQRRY